MNKKEMIDDLTKLNMFSAEIMQNIYFNRTNLSKNEYNEVMARLLSTYLNGIFCQHVLFENNKKDEELVAVFKMAVDTLLPNLRKSKKNLMNLAEEMET